MTNIGPLTTTFTPPSDCSWLSVNLLGSPIPTSTAFYNYKGIVWPTALRCFPSGYPYAYSDRFSGFYSPGICPSAWTAWYPTSNFPDPAETTAYCCPPGFLVIRGDSDLYNRWFPCFTTHIPPSSDPPALVISGEIDIVTKPYGDNTAGFITSSNFPMAYTGWEVFGVQVRYRTGDFGPNNHIDGTLSSNTQAKSLNPTPTCYGTTQTSIPDTNNDNSAVPSGAKIGIMIGIPLLVITLVIILAFVLISRRRRYTNYLPLSNGSDEYKSELPGNKLGKSGSERYAGKAELDITVQHAKLDDTATKRL